MHNNTQNDTADGGEQVKEGKIYITIIIAIYIYIYIYIYIIIAITLIH